MKVNVLRIKVLMAKRCMTEEGLATDAGICARTLRRVFTVGRCRTSTLGCIAKGLGVEVEELL